MRASSHPPKYLRVLASPVLIFFAAFAMRLAMMAHLLAGFGASTFYLHNEVAHIASALVAGAGYSSPWGTAQIAPTAQQPPVYPLLLAGVFRIFGVYTRTSAVVALTINAAAAAATAALLPYLAGRCLGERRDGVLAGWIMALWPYEAILSLQLWNQALAGLTLVVFVGMLVAVARSQHQRAWFGLGCFAGAAVLLNSALILPFVCAFVAKTRLTRGALLVLAGFLLLLTPWTVRNWMVFGRIIPLRDNFGFEVWVGNHQGLPLRHPMAYRGALPEADLRRANWNELVFLNQKTEEVKQYIKARPWDYVRRCAWRVLEFWMTPEPGYWLLVSLLSWVGALLAWRREKSFALIIATFPVVYYVTHVWPNYRYPIEPLLILMATYAVVKAALSVREMHARRYAQGRPLSASPR
ncbi:MAG TPA: glycosyltransferase family 39 protein [Terriglobales bacterium]|nr:glycosyltransferase family 39 protein [Terriglobales bacterium]